MRLRTILLFLSATDRCSYYFSREPRAMSSPKVARTGFCPSAGGGAVHRAGGVGAEVYFEAEELVGFGNALGDEDLGYAEFDLGEVVDGDLGSCQFSVIRCQRSRGLLGEDAAGLGLGV